MATCIYRDSGVGDHGITGIQTFLNDHTCGPVCRKLKLESIASSEDPPSPGSGLDEQGDAPELYQSQSDRDD